LIEHGFTSAPTQYRLRLLTTRIVLFGTLKAKIATVKCSTVHHTEYTKGHKVTNTSADMHVILCFIKLPLFIIAIARVCQSTQNISETLIQADSVSLRVVNETYNAETETIPRR